MSSKELLYSPKALQDLDEIWSYSAQMWDEERADLYIRNITSICENVRLHPQMAKRRDDIRKNYRSMLSGSHIIFFKETLDDLTVIRILHQRMDFQSWI